MTTLSHTYIPRPPHETKSRSSTIIFKRDPRKSLLPPLSPHYSKILLTQKKKKLLLLHGIPGSSDYLFGEEQLHYHYYIIIIIFMYIYLPTYTYCWLCYH